MAIPDDKSRLMVTLPEKLKSNFEYICEIDKRTSSKQLEYILEYYIENVEKRLSNEDYEKYYEEVYLPNQLTDKIIYFLTRKTGQYLGKDISPEYFYEIFKDEIINDKIVKNVLDGLFKATIPKNEFFLNCVKYYDDNKQKD